MAGKRRHFGAIRKLPSGRWQARYRGPDGLARPAPRTFERKQDAARWLALVEAEIAAGMWRDPVDAEEPLQEYAERWIAKRPTLRPRTAEQYRWLLRKHITPHLGRLRLADLNNNAGLIRSGRAALLDSGVSVTTAAKAYRLLHAVLGTATDDELIRRNPCRIRGAGREAAPERPTLAAAQVIALAGRMPLRYSALVLPASNEGLFALLQGLRCLTEISGDRAVQPLPGAVRCGCSTPSVTRLGLAQRFHGARVWRVVGGGKVLLAWEDEGC